jgi:hypothetical protein
MEVEIDGKSNNKNGIYWANDEGREDDQLYKITS